MDSFADLYNLFKPYIAIVALIVTWVGFGIAWWRQRGRFLRKEFLGQVNFSLNLFADTLLMRTLLEVSTEDVWPNSYGARLLHAAAKRTSDENPFIRLSKQDDRDYLHRAIKNALSELCPDAFIAAALGAPVRTGKFLFAMTCERYKEGMRTIKLRVILVEQNALREWCEKGGKGDQLPMTDYYRTRMKTLHAMYEMDKKAREKKGPEELGRVELGFAAG